MKPTLATYDFRPLGQQRASGSNAKLNASRDADQAMLSVVDRQLQIVVNKLRVGECRRAAEILRETYDLAMKHSTASPQGEKPLVVRLAASMTRVHLCVALSQSGRHAQALEEATMAKRELDIVWHLMTGASIEIEVADSIGDNSRPDPVLRRHVVNPPGWLERAIEASIHARLWMAVEMERMLPEDQFQAAVDAAEAMDYGLPPPSRPPESIPIGGNSKLKLSRPVSTGAIGSEAEVSTRPSTRTSNRPMSRGPFGGVAANLAEEDDDDDLADDYLPELGMPIPRVATGQELQGLYREALRLGAKLLPSGHQARKHAERVEKQARVRWKQVLYRLNPMTAQMLSSRPNTEVAEDMWTDVAEDPWQEVGEGTPIAQAQLPILSRAAKPKRGARPDSAFSAFGSSDVCSTDAGSHNFLLTSSQMLQSTDSFESGAAEWAKNAPPGDVFFRSLPSSFVARGGSICSEGSSHKNKRKKKKPGNSAKFTNSSDESPSSPISAPSAPATTEQPQERDPFKDWKKNYMDVGKMSLFQQKLMSLQGINSLRSELRDKGRQFSTYMKDLAALPDGDLRLGEDRVLYTDHGMKALQAGQLKAAAVRKKAWHPSAKGIEVQHTEAELFEFYGLPLPQDGCVDVKSLKTLMKESFERSPEEKRRREQEELAKKNKEEEENRRRRASLAAAFSFHKKPPEKPEPSKLRRSSTMPRQTVVRKT